MSLALKYRSEQSIHRRKHLKEDRALFSGKTFTGIRSDTCKWYRVGKVWSFPYKSSGWTPYPRRDHDFPVSGEIATASYYRAHLDRYGITTEITPARHSAIYRFSFPKTDSAYILLDATHSLAGDIVKGMPRTVYNNNVIIDTVSKDKVCGMIKFEGGFGEGAYQLFFCARFSHRPHRLACGKTKICFST